MEERETQDVPEQERQQVRSKLKAIQGEKKLYRHTGPLREKQRTGSDTENESEELER